ncbi:hypothetical protein [Paenibacillus sp. MMO-177]|uniref:hypothetical protein n=1 Tax=Paenibacillus sp. MMO-177 TaxID=3081289 RepID=UPI00301640FB
MGNDSDIIKELDFILTHPKCSVEKIETFYNQSLYVYNSVPILEIILHMQKTQPVLLLEWSKRNNTVRSLLDILDLNGDSISSNRITIEIDLKKVTAAESGIYRLSWETDKSETVINYHFKRKWIEVMDVTEGAVELIGLRLIDGTETCYNLYVKKGRKTK